MSHCLNQVTCHRVKGRLEERRSDFDASAIKSAKWDAKAKVKVSASDVADQKRYEAMLRERLALVEKGGVVLPEDQPEDDDIVDIEDDVVDELRLRVAR